MTIKNIKEKIDSIFLDTLQNTTDEEEASDDFIINFINNLMISCDKEFVRLIGLFEDEELTVCLKKFYENINAYKNTTQNIDKLTRSELSSINTLIKEMDDSSIEKASQKLHNLQKNLQDELSRADENIKKFHDEIDNMKQSSRLDNLTKTLNLKTYRSEMSHILEKGIKRDLNLCMLLIEISNLKEIKNEHGNEAGDKILIYIINLLNSLIRAENKIYRYSDNTFLIVLNRSVETDLHNMQQRIADKLQFQHVVYKNRPVRLHISSGIVLHSEGDDIDSFTQKAKDDKKYIL